MILLSTHSNEKEGDLQYNPGDPNNPTTGAATTAEDLFQHALGEIVKPLVNADVMLFLFACGSAVTLPSATRSLQAVVDT